MAPADTTTTPAEYSSRPPLRRTITLLTARPDGIVASRSTKAFVSSVTFGNSSAGSTASTCASAFARTKIVDQRAAACPGPDHVVRAFVRHAASVLLGTLGARKRYMRVTRSLLAGLPSGKGVPDARRCAQAPGARAGLAP